MNGFYIFVSICSAVALLVTVFLGRRFRRRATIKYLPSIFTALAGIGLYIKSAYFSVGLEDLGYLVLTLVAVVAFLISFLTAFIMGIIQRSKSSS